MAATIASWGRQPWIRQISACGDAFLGHLDVRRLQGAVGAGVVTDGVLALAVDERDDDAGVLGLGEEDVLGVHLVLGEALEGHLGEGVAADLADQGHVAMAQGRLDRLDRAGTGHGAGQGRAAEWLGPGRGYCST